MDKSCPPNCRREHVHHHTDWSVYEVLNSYAHNRDEKRAEQRQAGPSHHQAESSKRDGDSSTGDVSSISRAEYVRSSMGSWSEDNGSPPVDSYAKTRPQEAPPGYHIDSIGEGSRTRQVAILTRDSSTTQSPATSATETAVTGVPQEKSTSATKTPTKEPPRSGTSGISTRRGVAESSRPKTRPSTQRDEYDEGYEASPESTKKPRPKRK